MRRGFHFRSWCTSLPDTLVLSTSETPTLLSSGFITYKYDLIGENRLGG
jgi:hypothetical protein